MKYQSVPVPEDLIKTMNKTDSSNTKIRVDHFDSDQSIVQNIYSNNNKNNGWTHFNDEDISEDKSCDELDSS